MQGGSSTVQSTVPPMVVWGHASLGKLKKTRGAPAPGAPVLPMPMDDIKLANKLMRIFIAMNTLSLRYN